MSRTSGLQAPASCLLCRVSVSKSVVCLFPRGHGDVRCILGDCCDKYTKCGLRSMCMAPNNCLNVNENKLCQSNIFLKIAFSYAICQQQWTFT